MCTTSRLSIIPACPFIFPFLSLPFAFLLVSVHTVCLSASFLSVCRSIYRLHPQSLSVSFHLCVFDHPPVCLSLPSVCLPSYLSLTIYSACVSAYNSVSLIIGLSSCLSLLSVCRLICLSPSTHPAVSSQVYAFSYLLATTQMPRGSRIPNSVSFSNCFLSQNTERTAHWRKLFALETEIW